MLTRRIHRDARPSAAQRRRRIGRPEPVTLIVPFAPGGTTDIVGRIIAQQLSRKLGQTVVVENIGGAGGTLGATNAARAAPDGYTIFMATVAHTMAPGIYKSLAYNFEEDFDPITVVATVPNILIVNPSVPAKNVAELIAYLKANPGKVSYGSAGVGSTEHMSAELFRSLSGHRHRPRPLSRRRADAGRSRRRQYSDVDRDQRRGDAFGPGRQRARARGQSGQALAAVSGFADARGVRASRATTCPPGTAFWCRKARPNRSGPGSITQTVEILKDPDIIKKLSDFGAEPGGEPPAQFAAFIHDETDKWVGLAKKAAGE